MHAAFLTTGVVIVGAGAIVAAPVTVPEMIAPQRTVTVAATAATTDLTHGDAGTPIGSADDLSAPAYALIDSALPDPPPAVIADLSDPARDAVLVANAPVTSAVLLADLFANMPRNFSNVVAAAARNPADIPNLASFMAHCILLPEPYVEFDNDLTMVYRAVHPTASTLAAVLPAPLGDGPDAEPGLVSSTWQTAGNVIKTGLAVLPEPIVPGAGVPTDSLARRSGVKANGATDLSDGNKAAPTTSAAAARPGKRVRDAVQTVSGQVSSQLSSVITSSLKNITDTVGAATD